MSDARDCDVDLCGCGNMKEPEQELSMVHISTGLWLMGIDLVHGEETVTKNPLGIFRVTGEENLYHTKEGVDVAEKKTEMATEEAVALMEKVTSLADELGVPVIAFLAAIKELRATVPGKDN